MICPSCLEPLHPERLNLGFHVCVSCAQASPVPRYKGAMIYGHKTAGAVALMSPDEFTYFKRVTRRRGQQSVLRNVLHANGRAV
jgi:hypothetical protein